MRILLALGVACLLFVAASCSRGENIRSEPQQPPLEAIVSSDIYETGIASWYGDDFNGKTTANGEIYDMHKLTAAHQTLPFHTMVEVENLENGKKVLVRINDRGPFLKNRIIDLSLQAAQRLAMSDQGTAAVTIRVVHRDGLAQPGGGMLALNAVAECCVQVGAFSVRENAEDLLLTLAEIFPDLHFIIIGEDDMYKVLSEKFSAPLACQELIAKMADYHLQGFIRKPAGADGE